MEQSTCLIADVAPIQLSWGSHVVNNAGIGNARGIAVSIGAPPQFFSMKPDIYNNNTFVVNANQCQGGLSNYSCVAGYNGVYVPPTNVQTTSSSTVWNGTQGDDIDSSQGSDLVFYNDGFGIGNVTVLGVPFYTYNPSEAQGVSPSGLGLGPSSSFINTALAAQLIPNTAWSLWPGVYLSDPPIDGVVVIGGYDGDRISGSFTQFDVPSSGQLQVNIIGLDWQPSNGTIVDLMPSDLRIVPGYLQSYSEWLGLPQSSFETLLNVTEGIVADDSNPYWSSYPSGNLVITLSNGMTTTIPDSDLFYYPFYIDSDGHQSVVSTDAYQGSFFANSDASDTSLTLSLPYLTQHLLVSDPGQGKFWLADAVKTDLGTPVSKITPLCTGGPDATPTPKRNIAAIAGGTVGGVGALIILGIAIFMFRRHRSKKEMQSSRAQASEKTNYLLRDGPNSSPKHPSANEADMGSYPVMSPEMVGRQPNQEDYLPWNRRYDPANHELPTDAVTRQPEVRASTVSPEPVEMPTDVKQERESGEEGQSPPIRSET